MFFYKNFSCRSQVSGLTQRAQRRWGRGGLGLAQSGGEAGGAGDWGLTLSGGEAEGAGDWGSG